MMRVTIFLLSALALASVVLAQEREEKAPTVSPRLAQPPPSSSFDRVFQGLDGVNEKLDTNRKAILDVAGQLHDLTADGATHWISPHWKDYVVDQSYAQSFVTIVYIVNTSLMLPAVLDINVYNHEGVLDAERSKHRVIPPRGKITRRLEQATNVLDQGWLEVVSDRKVFVGGEIVSIQNFPGETWRRAIRTTTWYRADSE